MRKYTKWIVLGVGVSVLYLVGPGAVAFVREYGPSFFGVLALLTMAGLLGYSLRELLGDAFKRRLKSISDSLKYGHRRRSMKKELDRRALSVEEEQRIRTLALSARVYERAAGAIAEGKTRLELEELKANSENQRLALEHLQAIYLPA